MRRNCEPRAGETADPIGDDAHSPVEGIVHRYPDRVLLKLVHVCPVYCRFCFRREMVGPGRRQSLSRVALAARARLHPRASGHLGGHPDRRRSVDPVAAPACARSCARSARSSTSRSSACTPACRSWRRIGFRAALVRALKVARQEHLRRAACQPSARTDRSRARGLRADRRCRHPDAEPERAVARRQRRCRTRSAP